MSTYLRSAQPKEQTKATLFVKIFFLLHPSIPSSSNTAMPKMADLSLNCNLLYSNINCGHL